MVALKTRPPESPADQTRHTMVIKLARLRVHEAITRALTSRDWPTAVASGGESARAPSLDKAQVRVCSGREALRACEYQIAVKKYNIRYTKQWPEGLIPPVSRSHQTTPSELLPTSSRGGRAGQPGLGLAQSWGLNTPKRVRSRSKEQGWAVRKVKMDC